MKITNTREELNAVFPKEAITEVKLPAELNEITRLIFHLSATPTNYPDEPTYESLVNYVCNQIKQLAHEYQNKIGYKP
jgi:hypothetical protein